MFAFGIVLICVVLVLGMLGGMTCQIGNVSMTIPRDFEDLERGRKERKREEKEEREKEEREKEEQERRERERKATATKE